MNSLTLGEHPVSRQKAGLSGPSGTNHGLHATCAANESQVPYPVIASLLTEGICRIWDRLRTNAPWLAAISLAGVSRLLPGFGLTSHFCFANNSRVQARWTVKTLGSVCEFFFRF